jgi:hypothetical protein
VNPSWQDLLDTTLCDTVCQRLVTGQWFSPGTPVSSSNKTDHHNITEILLKVALNTIKQTDFPPPPREESEDEEKIKPKKLKKVKNSSDI